MLDPPGKNDGRRRRATNSPSLCRIRIRCSPGDPLSDRLLRTEEGKLYLFVAIDRTSKFVFAQLHEAANVKSAVGFLQALIEAVPYTIHIVLTDNGIQFGDMPSRRTGPTARYRLHMFDRICRVIPLPASVLSPHRPVLVCLPNM